jgi:hypothetical protein
MDVLLGWILTASFCRRVAQHSEMRPFPYTYAECLVLFFRVPDPSRVSKGRGLDSVLPKSFVESPYRSSAFRDEATSKTGSLRTNGAGTHDFKINQRLSHQPYESL